MPVVGCISQRQATPVTMPGDGKGKDEDRAKDRFALDLLIEQRGEQKAKDDTLRHEADRIDRPGCAGRAGSDRSLNMRIQFFSPTKV